MDIISRWSGSCDLADVLEIYEYTLEELQNNVRIYVGNNTEPLHIEKMSDIIPYYPHIVWSAYHNNAERKSVMHITSEPHVDREEKEILELYLEQLIKIYNRCKRNKIEFNVDEAVKKVCWLDWNKAAIVELAHRVKENGKKATIENIHLTMHELYRKLLVEEMLKNGVNLADIGNNYKRFINNDE